MSGIWSLLTSWFGQAPDEKTCAKFCSLGNGTIALSVVGQPEASVNFPIGVRGINALQLGACTNEVQTCIISGVIHNGAEVINLPQVPLSVPLTSFPVVLPGFDCSLLASGAYADLLITCCDGCCQKLYVPVQCTPLG